MKRLWLMLAMFAAGCSTTTRPASHVLFDDFNYTDASQLAQHGWIVRTAAGWPGVPGAAWGPGNVTFADGAMRMSSSTNGTPAGTIQTQICQQRKFYEGTYAARVRFNDAPSTGPNGDEIVETFYFISPQKAPMDPDYSEIDFEYLPNGGWGKSGPTMFTTTWETFQLEPWIADNTSTNAQGSLSGWHTLVAQVGNGMVRYFIDGKQFAEHGGKYYPEVPMSLNFNLWFVRDHFAPASETRRFDEDIDWAFFQAGPVLAPADVEARVAELRRSGIAFRDTVPASGLESPCNF